MDETKVVHLDTHILIWLFDGSAERLSKAARRAIDASPVVASPAAVLELELLYEIGRRRSPAKALISALHSEIGLDVCALPFRAIVDQSFAEAWTRDPFDRLIVANAKAARVPLITADERILAHYSRAVW